MKNLITKPVSVQQDEDIFVRTVAFHAVPVAVRDHLLKVAQALSKAKTLDAVTAIVRVEARDLLGADGATFVLRDGEQCYYADEDAISPLWKGQRFPLHDCVSGWVMTRSQEVVIKDVYYDSRVPIEAYRPTFVKSVAMVPIPKKNPIGAIGNYWATHHEPTPEEMKILQALADITAIALERVTFRLS